PIHIQGNKNPLIAGVFSDAVDIEVDTRAGDPYGDPKSVLLHVQLAANCNPAASVIGKYPRDSHRRSRRYFVLFVEREETRYSPLQAAADGRAADGNGGKKPLSFLVRAGCVLSGAGCAALCLGWFGAGIGLRGRLRLSRCCLLRAI